MPTDDPIDELMHRWETARHQGTDLSLESLCADCPELLNELRRRIRAVVAMEQLFGVTEHDPRQTMRPTPDQTAPELLPRIPGYEIIRIIDQGGMGVVYEARQLSPKRTVAIKM